MVEHSEDSAPLKGRYDFELTYNGGNLLAFEGDLKANSWQTAKALIRPRFLRQKRQNSERQSLVGSDAAAWVSATLKKTTLEYEWKELTPSAD